MLFCVVGEPTLIITLEVFYLKLKLSGSTCIAGGFVGDTKKARRVFTLRGLDDSYQEYLMKASLNPAALTFLSMASAFALTE